MPPLLRRVAPKLSSQHSISRAGSGRHPASEHPHRLRVVTRLFSLLGSLEHVPVLFRVSPATFGSRSVSLGRAILVAAVPGAGSAAVVGVFLGRSRVILDSCWLTQSLPLSRSYLASCLASLRWRSRLRSVTTVIHTILQC